MKTFAKLLTVALFTGSLSACLFHPHHGGGDRMGGQGGPQQSQQQGPQGQGQQGQHNQ